MSNNWQPIETAHEGALLLLYGYTYFPDHSGKRPVDAEPAFWVARYHPAGKWRCVSEPICEPTHWQPLPKPPTKGEA